VVASCELPLYQRQRHAFGGGSWYPGVLGAWEERRKLLVREVRQHCRENAEYDR